MFTDNLAARLAGNWQLATVMYHVGLRQMVDLPFKRCVLPSKFMIFCFPPVTTFLQLVWLSVTKKLFFTHVEYLFLKFFPKNPTPFWKVSCPEYIPLILILQYLHECSVWKWSAVWVFHVGILMDLLIARLYGMSSQYVNAWWVHVCGVRNVWLLILPIYMSLTLPFYVSPTLD